MAIKVLFLQTHYNSKGIIRTHGVDYARVINPAKWLAKHPDFEVEIRQDPTEGSAQKNWDEVIKHFDLIFCSYIDSPLGYVNLAMFSKKNHKPFIMDLDDNLWEVPHQSPTYQFFHPGSEGLHMVSCALEDTPYVATTNQFLKYRIIKYCKKEHSQVKVIPNFIDLEVYDYKKLTPRIDDGRINITFYGTSTHIVDMFETGFITALRQVIAENPNVYFKTIGFMLPQLKTYLKKQYLFQNGKADFYDWVNLWAESMSQTDIVVAPLQKIDFNRCKSNIKYLEYSAAKKPGVYADLRQYQEMVKEFPKRTGYLAGTESQWYSALNELVKSKAKREEIGQNAYDYVAEHHSIDKNITIYADYIKQVLEAHKKTGNLRDQGFILDEKVINDVALITKV